MHDVLGDAKPLAKKIIGHIGAQVFSEITADLTGQIRTS